MKTLIVVLILNSVSGDIEKHAVLGVAQDGPSCMLAAAEFMDKHKAEVGKDQVELPLCLDIEPLTRNLKSHERTTFRF